MSTIMPPGTDTQAEDVPLFAEYEPDPLPTRASEEPGLSADRRRTLRQAELIEDGWHPLTRGPLHRRASRHRTSTAPKDDPFTCGSCYFRSVLKYHDRTYPKCLHPGDQSATEWEHNPRRVSHNAGSDVRAWWPACRDYSPGSDMSPDAARSIPDGDA